jgi:hypothetical protein
MSFYDFFINIKLSVILQVPVSLTGNAGSIPRDVHSAAFKQAAFLCPEYEYINAKPALTLFDFNSI